MVPELIYLCNEIYYREKFELKYYRYVSSTSHNTPNYIIKLSLNSVY